MGKPSKPKEAGVSLFVAKPKIASFGPIKEATVPAANINLANKTFTLPATIADPGMYEFRVRMEVKKMFGLIVLERYQTASNTSTKAVPAN